MGLRGASDELPVCEIRRMINDMCQSDSNKDKAIREKLSVAEDMCKRMSKKLLSYNKKMFKGWWATNKDYEKDLRRRLDEKHIVG